MRRIEIALRHSATNQCCAIERKKYFCNNIGTTRKRSRQAFETVFSGKVDNAAIVRLSRRDRSSLTAAIGGLKLAGHQVTIGSCT
jgi:hypothetical protein